MSKICQKLTAFISYSHRDSKMQKVFMTHFNALKKSHNIDAWYDGCIPAGGNINDHIKQELNKSNIIILLITTNYINSYYCYEIELKEAIARQSRNECVVIPFILKKTNITDAHPFYNIKMVPTDGRPVDTFRSHNDGFADGFKLIEELICGITSKTADKIEAKKEKTDIYIEIPQQGTSNNFYINQSFINNLHTLNKQITVFNDIIYKALFSWSSLYMKDYRRYKADINTIKQKREFYFKCFLFDICSYTKGILIGDIVVRVHFRILKNEKYLGFVAYKQEEDKTVDWLEELSSMPINYGMIYESARKEEPLIKTLNPDYHVKSAHNSRWKEYWTYAIKHNPMPPLLSMGISVDCKLKDVTTYTEKFAMLSYIKFHLHVKSYILHFIDECYKVDKNFTLENVIDSISFKEA